MGGTPKMAGLFQGNSHPEMDDDLEVPLFQETTNWEWVELTKTGWFKGEWLGLGLGFDGI